jgi:hypothetical protein
LNSILTSEPAGSLTTLSQTERWRKLAFDAMQKLKQQTEALKQEVNSVHFLGDSSRRTGIVFGLRCDHLSGRKPARRMSKDLG